jgi:hypothetical protein
VIITREIALGFLRDKYGDSAPQEELQWQADFLEQEGSAESGAYLYTTSTWNMKIEYPMVEPEMMVYSIELDNSATDFRWQGQVDARGEVTEQVATAAFLPGITEESVDEADDLSWEIYVNERYGYEISFPPEANLEEMGIHGYTTDEQGNPLGDIPEGLEPDDIFEYLRETYGENLCVQITYSLGYITISVPENEGFRYARCGRTGVGVGELIPKEEPVQIDGMEIIAEGFEFRSAPEAPSEHSETMHLILPDATRIEFSSRASADASFEEYLSETKPVLLEILSTYRTQ